MYEHCDLWWKVDRQEHYLEVKTIVVRGKRERESTDPISKDLEKRQQLYTSELYHHLALIWPVRLEDREYWTERLDKSRVARDSSRIRAGSIHMTITP